MPDDTISIVGRSLSPSFPHDLRALTCLGAARTQGIAIPDELSVTGFDGVAAGIELIGLATLRIAIHEVATRAVQVMSELLLDPTSHPVRHDIVRGTFVAGSSLSTPRSPYGP